MRLSQSFVQSQIPNPGISPKRKKKITDISAQCLSQPSQIQFVSPNIKYPPLPIPNSGIPGFFANQKQHKQIYPSIIPSSHPGINSKWKNETKRRFFTQNEDMLLTKAAIQYNEKSWNIIAQCVPGRTPRQCRDRWMNYLKPNLKFDPWTKEEDELLISLVNSHGTHWTKMISHFPGRSTNAIKNRWNWLLKDRIHVSSSDDQSSKTNLPKFSLNPAPQNMKSSATLPKNEIKEPEQSKNQNINPKKPQNDSQSLINTVTISKSATQCHTKINEEDVFSIWQDPISLSFDAEEVNW